MSCGRRDKHNIAMKKRTLSCATGLRNLEASAKNKRSSSSSGNGKIAGDRVDDRNHGNNVLDGGKNGVHGQGVFARMGGLKRRIM